MDRLRIKIKIEDGQKGVPLATLSKINDRLHALLTSIGEFYFAGMREEDWVAENFGNHSVEYDIRREFPAEVIGRIKTEIVEVIDFDIAKADIEDRKIELYKKWIEAGTDLTYDSGKIKLSIYQNGSTHVEEERILTKVVAQSKNEQIKKYEHEWEERENVYYGGIQGIISDWHKEGRKPHIIVIDASSSRHVECHYPTHLYQDVYELFSNKNNIVYVSGTIRQDKLKPERMKIDVERFIINDDAHYFQEGDFEKFFGAAKDLGKGLSPKEYIEGGRDDESPS